MKGIVFTEFLEMVEATYGLETVDTLLYSSSLASNGIYTAVGTYSFSEMVTLITGLSKLTNIATQDLIYTFGQYFFNSLVAHHPQIFKLYNTAEALLHSIENHIHVEVRKMYPGAELPTFEMLDAPEGIVKMIYHSDRCLYMFAKALMEKTYEHFNKDVHVQMDLLHKNGSKVLFTITA